MFHVKHLSGKDACREYLLSLPRAMTPEHAEQVLEQLGQYIDLILKHAERRQLIAESQRDPSALWTHVYDSLQVLTVTDPDEWSELWDAGSGNGFPGVPLAVALPSATVHLIDRSLKKAEFLELAVATLSLKNTLVHCRELSLAVAETSISPTIAARALVQPQQWRGVLKSITSRPSWIIFATEANAHQWRKIASEFSYTIKSIHRYNLPGTDTTRCLLNIIAS
jgi:16S rRNA (guanine(527)-N(7))-methyltransferase RsmG